MNVPDYVENIIGYRQWNLSYFPDNQISRRFELSSPFIKKAWDLSEQQSLSFLKASCDLNYMKFFNPQSQMTCSHDAPHKDCTCGYHIYHKPEFVNHFALYNELNTFNPTVTVAGICQIAGKTQIYERGSRSEYIKIKALLAPNLKALFHFSQNHNLKQIQNDFERWLQVHQIAELEAPKLDFRGKLHFPSQWHNDYGKQITF